MIDLDDLEQVRLYDAAGRQVEAEEWRRRLPPGLGEGDVDGAWLDACLPASGQAQNPAKQLALKLYERMPLFWGDARLAPLAARWQRWVMQDAETAALSADLEQMARDWSMVRLPRFWPNAVVCVWLSDGGEGTAERQLAEQIQSLLQKRRCQTIKVAIPAGSAAGVASWHGEELGGWVALYLAALYGVDPAARVGWQYLGQDFGQEGRQEGG